MRRAGKRVKRSEIGIFLFRFDKKSDKKYSQIFERIGISPLDNREAKIFNLNKN